MAQPPLENYILVQNSVPLHLCGDLLPIIKSLNWKKHSWYNNVSSSQYSYEDKELNIAMAGSFLDTNLRPYVTKTINNYCENIVGKPIVSQFGEVRFNHYPTGTTMRQHFDHIHSLFDGARKGIPVLSIVGALNDDYQGGEFIFFGDYEVKLKIGDIMIFPSSFMYPHEVKEVTEGNRYSFVSWAF